jgi:hypothetical protein
MVVIRGRLEPEAGAVQIRALTVACDVQRAKPATVEANNVSAETSQRLTWDDSRVEMRHDTDGVIVEVGARTRTIPTALRRALVYRDHGCRFPGCDLPFGQAHHIKHWAQGGPTRCGIWSCSVVGTTEAFTKKAFGSSDERMASFSSARPTVTCCRRFHRLQRHQLTLLRKCARGIQRLVLVFIRTRPRQGGMAGR